MNEAERDAVMLWGLRARGRVGVRSGVFEHEGVYKTDVRCAHNVSIWQRCQFCAFATGWSYDEQAEKRL